METDTYLFREEAYLTISTVNKLFKYMGFVSKQNPDYNSFQGFIATMFRGLVERKISPAMVYNWLTLQVYWSLCQYEYNKELDVCQVIEYLNKLFHVLWTNCPFGNHTHNLSTLVM